MQTNKSTSQQIQLLHAHTSQVVANNFYSMVDGVVAVELDDTPNIVVPCAGIHRCWQRAHCGQQGQNLLFIAHQPDSDRHTAQC